MYGDAGKRLVLDAAGASRAKALIISYDDPPSAIKILHLVNDLKGFLTAFSPKSKHNCEDK